MDNVYQVSVIVASYNSDCRKLLLTIKRIIEQQDISTEIIVCDDGSLENYFDLIENLFFRENFQHYRFVKHQDNVGTVKNILSGIIVARGDYIFCTSPGDYLYDKYTLKQFYRFATTNNAKLCFGNAVYYIPTDPVTLLKNHENNPAHLEMFDANKPLVMQKIEYFLHGYILGATFLRERKSALRYIQFISNFCKYAEDTSVFFQIMDGERIYHFDEYVVWYEYGLGISTRGKSKFSERLERDNVEAFNHLYSMYPNDRVLKINKISKDSSPRLVRRIRMFFFDRELYHWFFNLHNAKKNMVNEVQVDISNFPSVSEKEF